ncbi:MAG TPA: hypothetical protein VMN39_05915 [Longimicrobiaceae bacterium]|nr:hypothetical protein [Longimicrobiaceae bacterium]
MSGPRPAACAFAGSLLIHLALLALLALQLVLSSRFPNLLPPPPEPEPVEVTVEMPEFLKPSPPLPQPLSEEEEKALVPDEEKALLKARRTYVRTTQNEREADAPEDASFISDRNTTAASELPAAGDPDRPELPSQEGADPPIAMIELATREFVDGRLADDATTGDNGPETRAPAPSEPPTEPPSPASLPATARTTDPLANPDVARPDEARPSRDPTDGVPDAPETEREEAEENAAESEEEKLLAMAAPPPREILRDLPADASTTRLDLSTGEATPPQPPVDATRENQRPEPVEPSEISLADAASLAAARTTSPVAPSPPPTVPRPRPGDPDAPDPDVFQPHTRRTHFAGGISNRGKSAVSAADTAVGRYGKAVSQAIERRWHLYRMDHADFVNYGSIKLQFQIDGEGRPLNLRIVENSANAVMTDFTLNAVLHASIPPIPKEVSEILEDGKFNITYDIIVY